MTLRMTLKLGLAMFALILGLNTEVAAQKIDCNTVTDDEIVKSIYDQMKVKHDNQIMHVNVRSSGRVVTLEGWTTTKKVRSEIEKIAKKTQCVNKKLKNQLKIGAGGGCGAGTKPCGTICIPIAEECNICSAKDCS
jgi:osmotically-inducible protein OsmY